MFMHKNGHGSIRLWEACWEDCSVVIARYLVEECHASVEEKDYVGWTALHCASINGNIEVVKYLVEECHACINKFAVNFVRKHEEVRKYLETKVHCK